LGKCYNLPNKHEKLGEWTLHFTLKQLRYVEAAGRLGSIAKAADELSISQSSITAAIDSLEFGLDYDIFVRTPAKGIQPTPSGIEALAMIRNFIHQARQFEAELQSIGGDATGLVRIACYATAAPAFLPPILSDITENFPSMSIQVLEGNMASIIQFLDEGRADLAFTYEEVTHSGHTFLPLFQAPPYALISVNDPLSERPFVTLADLAPKPMVMLDLPRTKEYFVNIFESNGVKPNIAHSSRSAEIVRALVAGGFGYTILNIRQPNSDGENTRYKTVPIRDTISRRHSFGIVTQTGARQPKIVTAFIDRCLSLQNNGAFKEITVWDTNL
jgi:DNA-binding transcriptional LysR family regulator